MPWIAPAEAAALVVGVPGGALVGRGSCQEAKCPGATANAGTGRARGSGSVQCGDDEVDAEDDDESADAEDRPVGELKRGISAALHDPIEVRGADPHRRGEQCDDDDCRDPGRGGDDEERAPFDHFASPLSLPSTPAAEVPAVVDSALAPVAESVPLPELVPLPESAPASVCADAFLFARRQARRFSLAACFSSHASRRALRLAMARLRLRSLRSLRLRPRMLTASPTVSKPERSVS